MTYRSTTLVPPSVLLVDDEASFLETLSKRIAKRDLKVATALSGRKLLTSSRRAAGPRTLMWSFSMSRCRAWTVWRPWRR